MSENLGDIVRETFDKIVSIVPIEIALRLIVAKILKLPISSYIFSKNLGIPYSQLGIDIPYPEDADGYKLINKIEKNGRFLSYMLSKFMNYTRNAEPSDAEYLLAHFAYTLTKLHNDTFMGILVDPYTKIYVYARIIKLSKILKLDAREILAKIGVDVSKERWEIWQKIVYVVISRNSKKPEVIERREKILKELEVKLNEKRDVYHMEAEFLSDFFSE